MPFGISPKRFLNSSGQFTGSSPFWLRNALVHLSRPTPLQPDQRASPDWAFTVKPRGYFSPLTDRFWNSIQLPLYGSTAS